MRESKGLRFAETSSSVENLREERLKNRLTFLKELNWDNYEKIRVVGKGAFGTAVLYRKKPDELLVVLKEINMNDLNASERQLAINEVKVLSILNHQNIISYYDSFESNGDLYIEMEYADAGTLADFLGRLSTPLQENEILSIFRQIVSAINHLHENNILHRDIKTANIFLNKEGYIKVGDFGISKMLNSRRDAESCVGTPYYISPEICEGKLYNQKSDIWALGCVLYEMACLQKTFEGSNLPALINKIVKGQFTPVKRNYSIEFRNLIKDLLQKNPDMRPTAHEVMENVIQLQNKIQNDRIQLWTQYYQDMPTSIITQGDLFQNSSSMRYPRSVVYEVEMSEPHIKLTPLLLPPKIRIKEISKSSTHFLALSFNSVVYSWGCGSRGQLGLGESVQTSIPEPKCIESIRNRNIVRICAGDGFSVFVSKNGLVMTCGDHKSGCLGRSDTFPCFTPKLVDALLSADVACVSCGTNHVSVVTGDGKAYSWGYNIDGRLGIGQKDTNIDIPTSVMIPDGVIIKNVFCGHDSTAFIDDNGCVWMCGNNKNNKLGLNENLQFKTIKVENKWIPTKLKWLRNRVHSVSLGKSHSAFLIEGGRIITSGSNTEAQLGMGHVRPLFKPHFVRQLSEQSIIKVQTGSCFTIASNYENVLYFWGARYLNNPSPIDKPKKDNYFQPEAIKLGECNQSLMNVVESIGPDHPIVQIRDPQIIIDNLNDLSLLSSTNVAVILKPQAIISLYASPVHLNHGDVVGLANLYCFPDDTIYIVIDTTIPLSADNCDQSYQFQNLGTLAEEDFSMRMNTNDKSSSDIPEWIKREIEDESIYAMKKADSLPVVFEDKSPECECHLEINKLRDELQLRNNTISSLQNNMKELQELNARLRRREQQLNKKFPLCQQCTIQ